jgi:hypothetical protein
MVKRILVCVGMLASMASAAAAADFSLTIGNSFAAAGPYSGPYSGSAPRGPVVKTKVAKDALFAVRLEQCPTLDGARITGVAKGIIAGVKKSASVVFLAAGSPGVYVATPGWSQNEGVWVVAVSAACGTAKAGALVSIGPRGFLRESIQLLPRAATKAEIDAALKTLELSGN